MAKGSERPCDLESVLAAARERPSPVYLFLGEPFETEAAARRLIDSLVPAEKRSFNLETYDGRTTSIGPVLDSLRTPGLFRGTKLVWVREPTLFLSGEKRADVTEALFAAWAEDRRAEAAEKLLVLLALAGWTQQQHDEARWTALSQTQVSDVFGRTLDAAEREALAALQTHCREHNLTVSAFRDESGLLEEFLAAEPPPTTVLVFTAAAADRRKRVLKRIRDVGRLVELTVERERSGALKAESVEAFIDRALAQHRKRIAPAARRVILQRAGAEAADLAAELEKLCLYVGEREVIEEEDARASVRDLAESWIFDFTRALAQRQAVAALGLLRSLFAQGEHPLRLLALIARELRLLLLARECLSDSLAGAWSRQTPFAVFRDRLLPRLSETQRAAFAGVHPFVVYQALQNAGGIGTLPLQHGVLRLQELDVKFKSSGVDPRLLLESFVLDMCRAGARR